MYNKIKRGDRSDTGDLEAGPTETTDRRRPAGSVSTTDQSALAEPVEVEESAESDGGAVIDDLTVYDAGEPTLGLTNIGEVPPEDWAADTGPSEAEGSFDTVTRDLGRRRSTLNKA